MTERPSDTQPMPSVWPGSSPAPAITERRFREPASLHTLFWRRFKSNSLAVAGLILMIFGPRLIAADPNKIDYLAINLVPTGEHIFGTDNLGRDTLARLVYGLRVSLLVAAYVELIDIALGVPLGLAAGYIGGKVDFV